MPIIFLDVPIEGNGLLGFHNILPLILISVFAIGTLAAIFFWRKNNKG
jgi:phage-related minor tail protein